MANGGGVVLTALLALLNFATSSLAEPLTTYNIGFPPAVKNFLGYPAETYLDFDQQVTRNGYLAEKHYVATKDGYILTVFRMKDPKCTSYQKVPVLLIHGLFFNSDMYLIAGEEAALGYLLARSCFDVWAGNYRGTNYGRNHTTLNPNKDTAFWDFYIDELAYYDNPAIIDYVIDATSANKINYIGYSMGGATAVLTVANHPEYNSKIGIYIGLAPALIVKNIRPISFRLVLQASYSLQKILSDIGIKEILFKGSLLQSALEFLCSFEIMKPFCSAAFTLFDGYNPGSISDNIISRLFSKLMMGLSVKLAAGYQQWIDSGIVTKYDYGSEENLLIYGTDTPPVYDLSKFKVPALFIAGFNDGAVRRENIHELEKFIPNLIQTVTLNDTNWNHGDFVASQNVPRLMYPVIAKYLLDYDI